MRRFSRRLSIGLCCAALCTTSSACNLFEVFQAPPRGQFRRTILYDGRRRTFNVFLPSAYSESTERLFPLLIAIHGGGSDAAGTSLVTGLSDVAQRREFVVVYPEGINANWNDGRPEINPGVDDVGFFRAMLDDMAATYRVDPQRMYATGISNGGQMALRLAVELSDRIAAVAAVATLTSRALAENAPPGRPVPVAIIGGHDDPVTPYAGGLIGGALMPRGIVLSATEVVEFWTARNHASTAASQEFLPDLAPDDGTIGLRELYAASTADGNSADFMLLTVLGGGHGWPGGIQYLPEVLIGRTSRDFSASEEVWAFVSRYSLRAAASP